MLNRCQICGTIVEQSRDYCPYCGYKLKYIEKLTIKLKKEYFSKKYITKEYRKFYEKSNNSSYTENEINNMFFLKRLFVNTNRFKNSPLEKSTTLKKKINSEKNKIAAIQDALKNVKNKDIKEKIEITIKGVKNLINSLVNCLIDIEFIRYIESFNSTLNHIIKNRVTESQIINKLIWEEETKYNNWEKSIIFEDKKDESIFAHLKNKKSDFSSMKEKISLILISNLLSTTTVLTTETDISLYQTDLNNIDHEIDKLNSEIERLNVEIELV
ncbi:hypothetical protein JXR93_07840 [bacterium]|nr:hypothetical protein [bacterium]